MSPHLLTNSDTTYVPSRTTYPPFSSYLKNPVSVAPIWLNTRFSEFPLKLVSQQDHHHFWCAILHCVLLQSLWRLRNNLVFIICIPTWTRTKIFSLEEKCSIPWTMGTFDNIYKNMSKYVFNLSKNFIFFHDTNITKKFEISKYFLIIFVFFYF